MQLALNLQRALDGVCAMGVPEVHENGVWLATLDNLHYEVRAQGEMALLHLWSAHQSLVRRVVSFAEESAERVVLDVIRLGHSRHARLEFVATPGRREPKRVSREQFSESFRRVLADRFPDEIIDSLLTSADLRRSISGSYTRGLMRRGSEGYAVLAASPNEDAATIDGMLTFGLIWLDQVRNRKQSYSLRGLRLFLPHGHCSVTSHRMTALGSAQEVELYEYDPLYWKVRRIPVSDTGNVQTWIVAKREIDQALNVVLPQVERIRRLAPDAIRVEVSAATREVTFRFRGLEFARWRAEAMWFGLGDHQQLLTPERWAAFEALIQQLIVNRHALASDTKHRQYRLQPERWLETMVAADPGRIDARLDPRHIYTQVPSFSSGDRGIIDLVGLRAMPGSR